MIKNKIVKILFVITLLVSIQLPAIAATAGIVNVDTVRVRKEPTTDSSIVELVSIGDKITITGEEGNWYKVKVGKVTGYIRKDLLTVEGDGPTSTEQTNKEEQTTETPIEETPEEVPVDETANTQPNEGSDENVQEENKKISTLKSTEGVFVGKKLQLTEEIEIKILPSANSTNIEKLETSTEVTVLEVINSWCRVETEGACGWVRIEQ